MISIIKYLITLLSHKFVYINENKITFLCLVEEVNDKLAFAFLNDVKKKLLQQYDYTQLCSYNSFQLNEFTDVIKQYMVSFIIIVELL
jgi:hypothetical protein